VGSRVFSRLGLAVVTIWPLAALAQNPVPLPDDVLEANAQGVPIDPVTRIDPARMPRGIGRRALEPLGITEAQLVTARAATYSAEHLADASGALQVFYTSVVRDDGRWVFWAEELPKEAARAGSEVQLELATTNGARYLVDFVIDSDEQPFAVVSGDVRTTQTPAAGHVALIVTATGKEHTVRLLPLGDATHKNRRFTLFRVTVTPIS